MDRFGRHGMAGRVRVRCVLVWQAGRVMVRLGAERCGRARQAGQVQARCVSERLGMERKIFA